VVVLAGHRSVRPVVGGGPLEVLLKLIIFTAPSLLGGSPSAIKRSGVLQRQNSQRQKEQIEATDDIVVFLLLDGQINNP
jgi:hypothetical protein